MSDTPGSIAAPRALAHAPPALGWHPCNAAGRGCHYESSRSCRWRGGMRRSPSRGWRVQWREAHRPHCRGSASARISYGLLSTMPSAIRAAWRARAEGRSSGSISANWLTRIASIQPRRLNLIMWVPLSPGWDDSYMRKACQRRCRRREGTRALGNDPRRSLSAASWAPGCTIFPIILANSWKSERATAVGIRDAPTPRLAAAISAFCEPNEPRIDGRGRDEGLGCRAPEQNWNAGCLNRQSISAEGVSRSG